MFVHLQRLSRTGLLVTAVALGACNAPTSPTQNTLDVSSFSTFSGEAPIVDVAGQRLVLQYRTAGFSRITITPATQFEGAAKSWPALGTLYQAGYLVHADARGPVNVDQSMTAIEVTTSVSGPFFRQVDFNGAWARRDFFGVRALQWDDAFLLIPADAIVDPASEISTIDALFTFLESGGQACVSADAYTAATITYRARRIRAKAATGPPLTSCR